MGLTVNLKTDRKLTVVREKWNILTVSSKIVNRKRI